MHVHQGETYNVFQERMRGLHVQGGSSRMYIGRRGVAWPGLAWRGLMRHGAARYRCPPPPSPRQLSDSCTGLFTCVRVYYNRAYDSNRSEKRNVFRRRYLHSRGRSMVDRADLPLFRRGGVSPRERGAMMTITLVPRKSVAATARVPLSLSSPRGRFLFCATRRGSLGLTISLLFSLLFKFDTT